MTRSTRTVPMLGAAAALVLALTACGGDGDSEYCDLLTSAEEDASLADADPSDPDTLQRATDTVREIADAAPDDIQGDWETLADAWDAFIDDPASVDETTLEEINTATQNIEENVQEECDIELG